MVNRRHIRSKVLQTIYAMSQNQSDQLDIYNRYLLSSIENIRELYLVMLSTLTELHQSEKEFLELSAKKYLATEEERNPNTKFVDNAILNMLTESESLGRWMEEFRINHFNVNEHYIKELLSDIKNSELYRDYMGEETQAFKDDKQFVIELFVDFIAPNEKIDRKSTRLNSSHVRISYAVFCLKKKRKNR